MSSRLTGTLRPVRAAESMVVMALLAAVAWSVNAYAQDQKSVDKWQPFRSLIGEWIGEGSGQPGQSSGGSTFTLELGENIIVRKSYNITTASKERPAANHQDMMVIYQDPPQSFRAIYWDNEGHTISYGVKVSSDEKILTFLTDVKQNAPTFRLIYEKIAADSLKVSFDFAPPGMPDNFSRYTSGIIHRK